MHPDEFIRRAIGVPFVEDGEGCFSGWSCWGLLKCFYRLCRGVEIEDYGDRPLWESIEAEKANWTQISLAEALPGDGVLLKGKPFHVGIYLEKNRMLHAIEGCATSIARLDAVEWANRLVGVYRRA